MFNKEQLVTTFCFLAFFLVLYLGCETKSSEHKSVEKSRAQKFELVNIDRLIAEALTKVPGTANLELDKLSKSLKLVETDSQRVDLFEKMASIWYSNRQPLISGHYAEKIAEIKNDVTSWSIAGTTYALAAKNLTESNQREHSISKSRSALEKAVSLDPENIDNQINLALTYVEAPLQENPMKGILMLRDMNQKHPDNVPVLMQLARLSIQTGQYQKAVDRLKKVVELRPSFSEAFCYLAESLRQIGKNEEANAAQINCK